MKSCEDVIEKCNKMIADGSDIDSVLQILRDAGYSKAQSIKALVDLDQANLADAKVVVHNSKTWRDRREQDELFQEQIVDALERSEDEAN